MNKAISKVLSKSRRSFSEISSKQGTVIDIDLNKKELVRSVKAFDEKGVEGVEVLMKGVSDEIGDEFNKDEEVSEKYKIDALGYTVDSKKTASIRYAFSPVEVEKHEETNDGIEKLKDTGYGVSLDDDGTTNVDLVKTDVDDVMKDYASGGYDLANKKVEKIAKVLGKVLKRSVDGYSLDDEKEIIQIKYKASEYRVGDKDKNYRTKRESEYITKGFKKMVKAIEGLPSGLGVGGEPRKGKPKTDDERSKEHGAPVDELPPRGTGLVDKGKTTQIDKGDVKETPEGIQINLKKKVESFKKNLSKFVADIKKKSVYDPVKDIDTKPKFGQDVTKAHEKAEIKKTDKVDAHEKSEQVPVKKTQIADEREKVGSAVRVMKLVESMVGKGLIHASKRTDEYKILLKKSDVEIKELEKLVDTTDEENETVMIEDGEVLNLSEIFED